MLNINDDIDVGSAWIRPAADANISLRGGGTIHKSSDATYPLFFLAYSGSKLILRDATLKGYSSNSMPLVYVGSSSALFVMLGGEISGNSASLVDGGGVHVGDGAFIMYGGTISGNEANYGGGVFVDGGNFTMYGGTISGNEATYGGGVLVDATTGGTFNKTGGTIYGDTDTTNSPPENTASSGNGHAVYVDSSPAKKRNTTADTGNDMNSSIDGSSGGWE
ncbi:hypothetical protein AGMMS50229_02690 [Campylobacterota bacterium]|nr:hypothetical protein AGMMS50229_02690 [Campylobacterota bacterium]